MKNFIHLHTHSHYSLLNALPQIKDLVKEVKDLGMSAVALTDAGNMYGAIDFYQACKKNEIKPIIGVDFYVASRTRNDKQGGIDNRRTRLVLLAKDDIGYKNLIKLITDSYFEGFYYKPRIDKELIEKYKEGLVCIMPHFSGETSYALKITDNEKAKSLIDWYKKIYGKENFYLEITHHPEIEGQIELKEKIIKIAKETDTNLVAGHDVYYLHPEDKAARDTLVQVNSHSDFGDREQRESNDDFSLISSEKAGEYFKDTPEAIENTEKIANMCNLEITLGKWIFPNYVVPSGLSHDDELRRIAYEGMKEKGLSDSKIAIDRLEYELKVIRDKGYSQYFLVVYDLLRFARENGIYTNIRGSVAGSLTTYVTGITKVDPIEYKLPFERFLNPERPSAPDIDMDFADNRRDEVIEYTRKKYGKDNVAQIGTFGTMMARGSCRDVARAMGYPLPLADKIAKLVPLGAQGKPMTLKKAMEDVVELKQMYDSDKDTKAIIDMAQKIEGCARHISVHAAGVVVAPTALTNYVPLQYDPKGEGKIITQYDMYDVGEDGIGLLKFDFLGIKNLSILADAVNRVKIIEKIDIDIEKIPLDDKKTFEMLARGETIGLFQLNGSGMTKYLKDLKPTVIHDINAMVALYRPGPIESIPEYIDRKHHPEKIKYMDPRMKEYLDQSYGVITYQDDVMLTAIKLAGYSWLEADKLRKAMGKKIPEEMQKQKDKLLKGFVAGGITEKKAETLWKLIEPFAAYGFNKCLVGDTEIFDTKNGYSYTIKEIYEKNLKPVISTMDDKYLLNKKTISMVMENGIKEIFEVKTRSGKTIKATANHPLFAFSGWKNIGDIKTGERIAVPRDLSLLLGKKKDKEKAAVLGYLISEGNLCHPHGIYFYSTQENEIKDFIKNCQCFKNFKYTLDTSKSTLAVYCGQENQRNGNSLNLWIKELGLKSKKATEKSIPQCVYEWDKETLSIFIGKMWQGDGCVSILNQQTYYATSSKKLAKDMQHLLLRLGILSTIHDKQFKYRGKLMPGYTVVISHRENLRKFLITAGKYLIGDKKNNLKELIKLSKNLSLYSARGTKDTIPAEILKTIREIMIEKKVLVSKISKETKLAERLFSYDKKKNGYQREVINIIGKYLKSEKLIQIANSDIYWDEIVSIKKPGKEMTYDITLPPYHNFVANDIIVHNSHAASYGRVAYQTAYMKANFPAIYMSAVLTADQGDVEKIGEFITECNRIKIPVLPPSINESFSPFSVVKTPAEQDKIRFGLTSIKNFGEGISKVITADRKKNGKFKSLSDFLERIIDRNLNKKSLEALIKTGALDEFGERGQLLANIENLLKYNKEFSTKNKDQDSLFGVFSAKGGPASGWDHGNIHLEPVEPATQSQKLLWEKDLLGLYISGHPLDKYRAVLEKQPVNIIKIKEPEEVTNPELPKIKGVKTIKDLVNEGKPVGGIIEEVREIMTKNNDPMAFIKIADFTGSIDAVIFPKTYAQYKNSIIVDKCIVAVCKVSERNGEISLIIERLKELN